jgi:hypothetical protein
MGYGNVIPVSGTLSDPGWQDVTAPSYWESVSSTYAEWESGNSRWNVKEFNPTGNPGWCYLELWKTGTWATGKYYTKFRITYTCSESDIDVVITTGSLEEVSAENYTSGTAQDWWGSAQDEPEDYEFLRFEPIEVYGTTGSVYLYITKIELYEVAESPHEEPPEPPPK